MNIVFHRQFLRYYKKRIKPNPKLVSKYSERLHLWEKDRTNPTLKDHQLTGNKSEYRSFWITGDIRVTYKIIKTDTAEFYNIGSHNQVY